MVIWKFPLIPSRTANEIEMPRGSEILCAGQQGDTPMIWAIVDPEEPKEIRRLHIVGTGHTFEDEDKMYVGTAFCGPFVWHVFEDVNEESKGA